MLQSFCSAATFKAGECTYTISDEGLVTGIISNNNNYIHKEASPLLSIQVSGDQNLLKPEKATETKINELTSKMVLHYENGIEVSIKMEQKKHYLKCSLLKVKSENTTKKVIWGPYKTTMSEAPSTIAGILRDNGFSLVIQSLNAKTIGGRDEPNVRRDSSTSRRIGGGSSFEAFSKDRTKPETRDVWASLDVYTKSIPGETVIGSSVALFGCQDINLLDSLLEIEKGEGLASPVLKGEWNKKSSFARSTRFFVNFSESNIDECIELAQAAGVKNLYHPGPFETFGHFKLRSGGFPNGRKGLKICVKKAKKAGVTLGVHTLSNFITANDAYITPKPHPNIAISGITKLTKNLDLTSGEIYLADDTAIDIYRKQATAGTYEGLGSHKVLRIGDELIYFNAVSEDKPWILYGCKRGWNGTKIEKHKKGSTVAKLISHPYKVFFPDIELQTEMAENLADFFNETGVERIGFDGFEGCHATGHGKYACNLFAESFYNKLENKNIVFNSSIVTNFTWHMVTNLSWGEPHYGEFRGSQLEYRFNAIKILRDNLIPYKLGQYKVSEASLADINWLMGVSAGHKAGIDLYVAANSLSKPGNKEKFEAIKNWTNYRKSGRMTPALQLQLQNQLYEFKLKRDKKGLLNPVFVKQWINLEGNAAKGIEKLVKISDLVHISKSREPGQPTQSTWKLKSPTKQLLSCQIGINTDSKKMAARPTIHLGTQAVTWKGKLNAGDYLHLTGKSIDLYRDNKKLSSQKIGPLYLEKGENLLNFDYTRQDVDTSGPPVKVDILTPGIDLLSE